MKVISWNVNGIRAVNKKNCNGEQNAKDEMNVIEQMTDEQQPDVLCLQEIKTDNKGDLELYRSLYPNIAVNSADKKGYSGTAILSKEKPIAVYSNFYHEEQVEETESYDFTNEGRLLTAEFQQLNVICCYTVNAKNSLERLDDRQIWDELFKQHIILTEQKTGKPCIVVGDLNVAHKPVDLYNNKSDCRTAGLSKEERHAITEVDILNEYYGSDHCPVMVHVNL